MVGTILTGLVVHRNKLIKAIAGLSVALLLGWALLLNHQNKKLSESLELAQNNIEAYQGSLAGSQQANNVLKLTVQELQNYNDNLVSKIDSVRKELNIKTKQLNAAATQTQVINVNQGKEVVGDIITILKDSVYSDSIKFNDLTTVRYTIGKDTVNIGLDVHNTQYFYLYTTREYKNKKSFIKRLFTFDFKKVNKYKYSTVNTNDLIQVDSVRVIEMK